MLIHPNVMVAVVLICSCWQTGGPPQAVTQVPAVSKDPAVQRQIELQLTGAASLRLDPNARVASLNLTARPLREIVDAVAKAGGVTLRYASGVTSLDTPSSVVLSDKTVEDALRTVLASHALTFQTLGPKTVFIHPDTAADREKYTASIRVFPIARANPAMLAQQMNQTLLKPTADGFRAMVLTVRDSAALVVRAVPELMTPIANWIAEHDKNQ